MTLPVEGDIDGYYHNREHEFGFASMSRMTLPGMKGQRVLNVCCRRGKGVFKMSAMVGKKGRVIGVDWSPSYIAEAEADSERAWRKNHLQESNMEFHVAYPEDLMEAGIGDNSVDMVYINNVMTLLYDQEKGAQGVLPRAQAGRAARVRDHLLGQGARRRGGAQGARHRQQHPGRPHEGGAVRPARRPPGSVSPRSSTSSK